MQRYPWFILPLALCCASCRSAEGPPDGIAKACIDRVRQQLANPESLTNPEQTNIERWQPRTWVAKGSFHASAPEQTEKLRGEYSCTVELSRSRELSVVEISIEPGKIRKPPPTQPE